MIDWLLDIWYFHLYTIKPIKWFRYQYHKYMDTKGAFMVEYEFGKVKYKKMRKQYSWCKEILEHYGDGKIYLQR